MRRQTETSPLSIAPIERDLLVAAVGKDAAAVDQAWERWRAATELDTLSAAQFPLLPRLYANLARFDLADTADGRIKGIYRRAWVRTQQQLALAERLILPMLTRAGVPAVLMGDAAVALDLYPHPGERAVERLDFLIEAAALTAASKALAAAGWQPTIAPAFLASPALRRWCSQTIWQHQRHPAITVNWRPLPSAPAVGADPRLDALTLQRAAAPPRTSRAAQLVLAGVQAAQGGTSWLMAAADLGMALCGAAPIAWTEVGELAALLQASGPLASVLPSLAQLFDLPLETALVTQLHEIGAHELSYERFPVTAEDGTPSIRERASFHIQRWRRLAAANGVPLTMSSSLEYLRVASGATHNSQLPGKLLGAVRRGWS